MAPEVSPTIFTDDCGAENWHEEIIHSFCHPFIHSFLMPFFPLFASFLYSFIPEACWDVFFSQRRNVARRWDLILSTSESCGFFLQGALVALFRGRLDFHEVDTYS